MLCLYESFHQRETAPDKMNGVLRIRSEIWKTKWLQKVLQAVSGIFYVNLGS